MAQRCPHLDYRSETDERSFDHERAYCTVVERFVQPMRADVCNARHGLSPQAHCEFYREHEGLDPTEGLEPAEWPAAEGASADAGTDEEP